MSDIEFVNGMKFKAPRDNAPEYVKASISINREELIAWLQGHSEEWINCDLKVSKSGNWFAAVNTWKPKEQSHEISQQRQRTSATAVSDFVDDDLPPF